MSSKKSFLVRSRKDKQYVYINTKNKIRQYEKALGGLFFCRSEFIDDQVWLDFVFLGLKKPIVWNATMQTMQCAYDEAVRDKAIEELFKVYPDYNPGKEMVFEPIPAGKKYGTLTFLKPTYKELGGKTSLEWREQKELELVKSGAVQVRESIKKCFSYSYGIGLHIVKDVKSITPEIIHQFVEEFRAGGEKELTGAKEYSFSTDEFKRQCSFQAVPLA